MHGQLVEIESAMAETAHELECSEVEGSAAAAPQLSSAISPASVAAESLALEPAENKAVRCYEVGPTQGLASTC